MNQNSRNFVLSFLVAWALVEVVLSIVSPSGGWLALPALYVAPTYIKLGKGFDDPITSLFVVLCIVSVCGQLVIGWFTERVVARVISQPSFSQRVLWQACALIGQIIVVICMVRVLTN